MNQQNYKWNDIEDEEYVEQIQEKGVQRRTLCKLIVGLLIFGAGAASYSTMLNNDINVRNLKHNRAKAKCDKPQMQRIIENVEGPAKRKKNEEKEEEAREKQRKRKEKKEKREKKRREQQEKTREGQRRRQEREESQAAAQRQTDAKRAGAEAARAFDRGAEASIRRSRGGEHQMVQTRMDGSRQAPTAGAGQPDAGGKPRRTVNGLSQMHDEMHEDEG